MIPAVLVIRDGWGVREESRGNAVAAAATPRLDALLAEYPSALIDASEHHVGLPDGQMGNSEVGHLNIGAGRVVYQDFSRIAQSISDGSFFENEALVAAVDRAFERNRALHIVGLLSDGGVHSHIDHLIALLRLAKKRGMTERVYIHAILDGRDTSPTGGVGYLRRLQGAIDELGLGQVASVIGRFFTMDRDKRWERVQKGYELMVRGLGAAATDAAAAVERSYEAGITDEFLEPIALRDEEGGPRAVLKRGDQVLMFNFRADRARQICRALADPKFAGFERGDAPAFEVTALCEYEKGLPFAGVAFPPSTVSNHIAAYLSGLGRSVFKAAETEKYGHVTFFFNGGVEAPCQGEERLLVPSPRDVKTYDLKPEMSAFEVCAGAVKRIETADDALVVINFANTDMVGHTGNFDAVVRAVEVVDDCVGRVMDAILAKGGAGFITADHGNCEKMIGDDGGPHTAHTTCPVHGILVSAGHRGRALRSGALSNLAPTLLEVMGLPAPKEMTAPSLLALP